jgi:hypothetical protein
LSLAFYGFPLQLVENGDGLKLQLGKKNILNQTIRLLDFGKNSVGVRLTRRAADKSQRASLKAMLLVALAANASR